MQGVCCLSFWISSGLRGIGRRLLHRLFTREVPQHYRLFSLSQWLFSVGDKCSELLTL